MEAVTVFRSTDDGAPQMPNRTPGEIIDIIHACLVDGYGTKQPLGWTKEFGDTAQRIVAYRNKVAAGGSGGYVKFWDATGINAPSIVVKMQTGTNMTDIDTIANESYISAIGASVSAGMTTWILIGTPTAFYFFVTDASRPMCARRNTSQTGFFCGDFAPYIPNDAARFIATGTPDLTGDFPSTTMTSYSHMFNRAWMRGLPYGSSPSLRLVATDNSGDRIDYGFADGHHDRDEYVRGRTDQRKGIFIPMIIGVRGHTPNSYIKDPDGVTYGSSVKWPLYRGELPGLLTEVFSRYESATYPTTDTINGHEHFLMSPNGTTAGVWINMEEW